MNKTAIAWSVSDTRPIPGPYRIHKLELPLPPGGKFAIAISIRDPKAVNLYIPPPESGPGPAAG